MNRGQEKGQAVEGVPHQDQSADSILSLEPSEGTKSRQRNAILAALQRGPLTTVQAREGLGILHPGGRVLELRKLGYRIETQSRTEFDSHGRPHRVASYVLRGAA